MTTGTATIILDQNVYDITGDDVLLRYRTADTPAGVVAAGWINYVGAFESLGYVQVRLESTL